MLLSIVIRMDPFRTVVSVVGSMSRHGFRSVGWDTTLQIFGHRTLEPGPGPDRLPNVRSVPRKYLFQARR